MDFHARFGLQQTPFTRELGVDKMLSLPHLEQARDAIVARLERRMSAAVLGPAGCGKTCLLRMIRDQLPQARYRVHYVKVTELSKRDLCREVATAIGLPQAGSYPMLVRRLQDDFEQRSHDDGQRPVLVLDEAHDIRPEVLSILRILTNFDWDSKLVVSIVLAGQPRLETLLHRGRCEDVAQRIDYYAKLRLLSREESARYLEHRCTVAGAAGSLFDPGATEALFEMSRGNLRALDRLALASLDEAARRGASTVGASDVTGARRQILS